MSYSQVFVSSHIVFSVLNNDIGWVSFYYTASSSAYLVRQGTWNMKWWYCRFLENVVIYFHYDVSTSLWWCCWHWALLLNYKGDIMPFLTVWHNFWGVVAMYKTGFGQNTCWFKHSASLPHPVLTPLLSNLKPRPFGEVSSYSPLPAPQSSSIYRWR